MVRERGVASPGQVAANLGCQPRVTGMTILNATSHFPAGQHQRFNTSRDLGVGGFTKISHPVIKQAENRPEMGTGGPVPRAVTIYYLKCSVSNKDV